jgi:hypothetical protein
MNDVATSLPHWIPGGVLPFIGRHAFSDLLADNRQNPNSVKRQPDQEA